MHTGDAIELEGVVERIVFFNDETHFCIAQVKPTGKEFSGKNNITAKGVMPNLECGETVLLKGEWISHPTYGGQIKVKSFESRLPSSVYGIEKFLGSGLIAGIGKEYAKRIVKKFGIETINVIDKDSAKLLTVDGIGDKRYKQIRASWEERKCLSDVLIFLQRFGVGISTCLKIVKKYGADASTIVREQPYKTAREIDGIGFKTADKIALNSGIANESAQRVETGIIFALKDCEDNGDTCVPAGELEAKAAQMLEVSKERCREGINALLKSEDLKLVNEVHLQSASLDYNERVLAEHLKKIILGHSILPAIKYDAALEWAKARAKIEFAPEQSDAILSALKNKFSIITGGPGTGKTTILRALCDILRAKKVKLVLAAPTGRAAQRMSESTRQEAKTIHRLLGFDGARGVFTHNAGNPLDAEFVVVDEASMLDTRLAAAIFSAIPQRASLVLVGDTDQLPSVGAGNVLKDIIASEVGSLTRLNRIFRQGERSQIVLASHDILQGKKQIENLTPTSFDRLNPEADVHFVNAETPEECLHYCLKLAKKFLPQCYGADPISGVQVLAPMHRGVAGIGNFNAEFQKELNKSETAIGSGANYFKLGDKVMQTRNNYDLDIFNGDMAIVKKIKPENGSLIANFDGREIEFSRADASDLQLAYAISIHKSQGSEFPIVIIPLLKQHFMMLQRNLIYTAISRARRKVFIVGDPYAFECAVKNASASERRTALKDRLKWQ